MAAITDGTEEGLSEDDRLVCAQIMDGYIQGVVPDPVAAGDYPCWLSSNILYAQS